MDKNTVDKNAFIKIIELLEKNKIRFWIEGGWGVDALFGKQTREHRDIDVDFDCNQEEDLIYLLKNLGYSIVLDERPVRMELYHDTYGYMDIHPFIIGENEIKQVNPQGGFFLFNKEWFTTSTFQGRKIPCFTLEAQKLFHSGYELRAEDILDLKNLERLRNLK